MVQRPRGRLHRHQRRRRFITPSYLPCQCQVDIFPTFGIGGADASGKGERQHERSCRRATSRLHHRIITIALPPLTGLFLLLLRQAEPRRPTPPSCLGPPLPPSDRFPCRPPPPLNPALPSDWIFDHELHEGVIPVA